MLSFLLPIALAGAPLLPPGVQPAADSGAPSLASTATERARVPLQEQETYDELLRAYEGAEQAWRHALRDAEDSKARKALRENHPAPEYAERFAALVAAGDGRGLLWELGVVRYLGFTKSKERKAREQELLGTLVEEHCGAEWFNQVLPEIAKRRRDLGPEKLEAFLTRVGERSRHPEIQAEALFTLAQIWGRDEETREKSFELLADIAERFAETEFGRQAQDELFRLQNLIVGALAPDFEATTFDGTAFRLSDHRGKVVVLDFFGFW
ncbi:MAG: hypothetical protein ACYS26_03710 [Planctomycetota bacterium]|jgi:hypothetical protein